jgi:hypothetical protein
MTDLSTHNSEIEYQKFVIELIELVQQHRIKAIQAVQSYTNQLYWEIGELIIKRQLEYGWGKSIVKQLSNDLNQNLGNGISWSPRNLWLMRQLVEEYSKVNQTDSLLESAEVYQLGSELENIKVKRPVSLLENVKILVCNVPWQHNVLILQKVKDPKAR